MEFTEESNFTKDDFPNPIRIPGYELEQYYRRCISICENKIVYFEKFFNEFGEVCLDNNNRNYVLKGKADPNTMCVKPGCSNESLSDDEYLELYFRKLHTNYSNDYHAHIEMIKNLKHYLNALLYK
jgi:hypothetical protein